MRYLSVQELEGKLETFPAGFRDRFGADLDYLKVKTYLENQLLEIEQKMIAEGFSGLNPESIRTLLKMIEVQNAVPTANVEQLPAQENEHLGDSGPQSSKPSDRNVKGNKRARRA